MLNKLRLARLTAATSLGLALAACGPDATGGVTTPIGLTRQALSGDPGLTASSTDPSGVPGLLEGKSSLQYTDSKAVRGFLLGTEADVLRLTADSDLMPGPASVDENGSTYYAYTLIHKGVEVSGSSLVVEVDQDGWIVTILTSGLGLTLPASVTPALSGTVAVGRALGKLSSDPSKAVYIEAPALRILVSGVPAPRLAYRAVVEFPDGTSTRTRTIYVDPGAGDLLSQARQELDLLSRSIYTLGGTCATTGNLPGALVMSEGGTTADAVAQAAYNNTGASYGFYQHQLGRNSYDGAGAALKSTVHATFQVDPTHCDGNNAFWYPGKKQMLYGDGGHDFLPLANALDVTAHELTHAVTHAGTPWLDSINEAGAMDEALSDMFGAGAEAWHAAGGGVTGSPALASPTDVYSFQTTADTWKVGEQIALPTGYYSNGAIRFMNDPAHDVIGSRDYYPQRYQLGVNDPPGVTYTAQPDPRNDYGYVHFNNGIANLAFYLLSQGGAHPRGKTTNHVRGIHISKAMRIFYHANVYLHAAPSGFEGARDATLAAAKSLYGPCSPEVESTRQAWIAVGVPPGSPCLPLLMHPEIEPNNDPAHTNLVPADYAVNGWMSSSGDQDYYSFKVNPLRQVTLSLQSPLTSHNSLTVFNQDGTPYKIAAYGSDMSNQITIGNSDPFNARIYKLAVKNISGPSTTSAYFLFLRSLPLFMVVSP